MPVLSAIIILVVYAIELSSCFNNYFEARGIKFRVNVLRLLGVKRVEEAVESVEDNEKKT